jgi:putative transposase
MKLPSVYLKMRVLGAIDTALGRTRHQRLLNVTAMTFLDEEGNSRQFTWRTIQTWFYRYKNHGITGMTCDPRKDKGQTRKVTPEELLEALNAARPHFHNARSNKRALYRFCIENGLLHPERIAQTTFYRFIRDYDLLANEDTDHKPRLAFSMKFANQLWQADTMFGPHVDTGMSPSSRKQAKLIAFIDDASRVLCHGEFFFDENVDTLVQAPPSTNAVSPSNCSSITAPSTACGTLPFAMLRPKEKSKDFFAASAISSWSKSSIFPPLMLSTASSPTGSKTTTMPCLTTPSA